MFKLDPKWLVIGILLLGMFGYWHWMTSQVDYYKTLSQRQAQQLNQQSAVISQLKTDIERNRQATLEITKSESELRSKSDEVIKYIPVKTKQSSSFNSAAPRGVIEFLRQ